MGYRIGLDIAESSLDLTAKMSWHLQGNHYPPVDDSFIPVAVEAIEQANTNNWDEVLLLPNGLERTVAFVIEGLHLQPFVDGMIVPGEEE
jgi:hypothetical protein